MAEEVDDWVAPPAAPSGVDDWVSPAQQQPTGWGATALDVGKQAITRPIAGVEGLATGPAKLIGAAGRGIDYLFPKLADPEAAAQQQKMREIASQQGGAGGISQYLPKAETTPGKFVGAAAEMLPVGLVQPGSLVRRGAEAIGAGVASEGAGELTAGTPLEPYARAAGALVGGYPAGKAAQFAQNLRRSAAAPSVEALVQSSDKAYAAARKLGVYYDPDATLGLRQTMERSLLEDGFRPAQASGTFGVISELETAAAKGKYPQFSDFDSARKALGRVAGLRNTHPPYGPTEDAAAAVKAIDHIDDFLTNPRNAAPGYEASAKKTAELALKARGDWAAKSRAQSIERAVESGELGAGATGSGANIDNRLRQQAVSILKNQKRLRGYSAEDKAMLREIATGTVGRNIARYIGKGTPTGVVSAAAMDYIAHTLGLGPLGHAAVMGGAYLGKKAADVGTKHAYSRLGANLRANSPLGRSMRIPAPGIAPSAQAAGARGMIGLSQPNTEEKKRRDVLEGLGRALSGGHKSGGRVDNRASAMRALSRTK